MKAILWPAVSALTTSATAIPADGYTPPKDMPDGAYLDCPSSCTGYDLNPMDYATVQHCMDNFLDRTQANGGYGNEVWYCRAGDTLLAVCNYENVNYGGTSEINTFNGIMDSQCGSYRSGWVFIKAWQKTYWRTDWGENICGNAGGPEKRHDVTSDYSN